MLLTFLRCQRGLFSSQVLRVFRQEQRVLGLLQAPCNLCFSLHSPLGSTHGVTNHDPSEDFSSPVRLALPPPLSLSSLKQAGTEELLGLLA